MFSTLVNVLPAMRGLLPWQAVLSLKNVDKMAWGQANGNTSQLLFTWILNGVAETFNAQIATHFTTKAAFVSRVVDHMGGEAQIR